MKNLIALALVSFIGSCTSINETNKIQFSPEDHIEENANTSDFSENKLLGSWGARYSSTNGDGYYNDYIIFKKNDQKIEAIRWAIAKCNRCKAAEDRKPYISDFPKSTTAENGEKLITQMKLHFKSNQLIEIGNSPLGEDIVFEPKPQFVFEPFESECRKKNFLSCFFLAEMYSVNKNAEKALELWKIACKGGLESACKKIGNQIRSRCIHRFKID